MGMLSVIARMVVIAAHGAGLAGSATGVEHAIDVSGCP